MKQIRRGVFETNSSSTHSLTIFTEKEFADFKTGKLIFDRWNSKLIDVANKEKSEEEDNQYWDLNNFGGDMETDSKSFSTPSGDKMIAMCYYGYDG